MIRRGGLWLALCAVALTACGTSALSTKVLRARATRICTRATAQENAVPTPTRTGEGAAFLQSGAGVLIVELRALRKLDAGGRAASVYATALRALSGEEAELTAGARTLTNDVDAVSDIRTVQSRLAPLEASAQRAWTALGIPACATG